MDQLHERLNTLEQQVQTLTQHTYTATRRLRRWRSLACGAVVLAVLTWALPAVIAQEEDARGKGPKGLAQRVAALEDLLKHFSREKNEIFITGANLHIRNGLGLTECGPELEEQDIPCNGLGNLIVGYNEPRGFEPDVRTGSHNVVIGQLHNFSSFGGLVTGFENTISGGFAVVTAGAFNTASGRNALVSGGNSNTASGMQAVVSGGNNNTASGGFAVVTGGDSNTASGGNTVVSGGNSNTASGFLAMVSGGGKNPFTGEGLGNTANGVGASVSGGQGNEASGGFSSVSGGRNRTAEGDFDWVAGSLLEDE
jgi:hypothetical protein